MAIQVGESIPSVDLQEGTPGNKVNTGTLFKGKKAILFGVPGAFTPGCDKTHLPGYVQDFDKYAKKGVDLIACVAVNDVFVMAAWGESQGAEGKVRMLADPHATFTKALGLDADLSAVLGTVRSKRFSALIEDGTVKVLNVEPDGTGLSCSLSNELLDQI